MSKTNKNQRKSTEHSSNTLSKNKKSIQKLSEQGNIINEDEDKHNGKGNIVNGTKTVTTTVTTSKKQS